MKIKSYRSIKIWWKMLAICLPFFFLMSMSDTLIHSVLSHKFNVADIEVETEEKELSEKETDSESKEVFDLDGGNDPLDILFPLGSFCILISSPILYSSHFVSTEVGIVPFGWIKSSQPPIYLLGRTFLE